MVSRINFFVELVKLNLQALDLPHVCYLAFLCVHKFFLKNLENCLAIHVFHLLYLFVWEILCLVLFVRYCACIEHNILILI